MFRAATVVAVCLCASVCQAQMGYYMPARANAESSRIFAAYRILGAVNVINAVNLNMPDSGPVLAAILASPTISPANKSLATTIAIEYDRDVLDMFAAKGEAIGELVLARGKFALGQTAFDAENWSTANTKFQEAAGLAETSYNYAQQAMFFRMQAVSKMNQLSEILLGVYP